jgi:hypothetical protein
MSQKDRELRRLIFQLREISTSVALEPEQAQKIGYLISELRFLARAHPRARDRRQLMLVANNIARLFLYA